MKKTKCQITGEEINELSVDEALEVIKELGKVVKDKAVLIYAIDRHFESNHSLSFVQFEAIKKANGNT